MKIVSPWEHFNTVTSEGYRKIDLKTRSTLISYYKDLDYQLDPPQYLIGVSDEIFDEWIDNEDNAIEYRHDEKLIRETIDEFLTKLGYQTIDPKLHSFI